jgi:hypothetical protein
MCLTIMVKNQSKDRPCVKFCHVDIREHGRILIDHPKCKDGIPIGLDWAHSNRTRRIPIELFERVKGKRSKKPIERLSTVQKALLLVDVGAYREEDLWNVCCKSFQARNMMNNCQTLKSMKEQKFPIGNQRERYSQTYNSSKSITLI